MCPQAQVAMSTRLQCLCPTSSSSSSSKRQHTLMGSRLTVLCRAHVEAITADVSRMQICSKWLTICHSFNPPPPTPLALYLCPSNPFMSLSVYASIPTLSHFNRPPIPPPQSLQRSHSFSLCLSLFSRSVQRGLWAAQWRIWRLFSTVSCVTSSTSDTRSLTTTSTLTTMRINRYMGCTRSTVARTHTHAHLPLNSTQTSTHTSSLFFIFMIIWHLGVLALCVLMERYFTFPCQSAHRVQFPSR